MIRKANVKDYEELRRMIDTASAELEERYSTPNMAETLAGAILWAVSVEQPVMVAQDDGKLVGYCAWVRPPRTPEGCVMGMGTWVDPDVRCQGVGGRLRDAAIAEWKALGGRYVLGTVAAGNEAARELLRSDGFVISGYEMRLNL